MSTDSPTGNFRSHCNTMADFLVITSNGIHMMQPLIEQTSGRAVLPCQAGFRRTEEHTAALEAVNLLRAEGAGGIILGCTELPLLLRPVPGEADRTNKAEAPDLINPAQLLAEAAVRYVME